MKKSFVSRFLACLLLQFVLSSRGIRTEDEIIAQRGADVSLSWNIPERLTNALLVVSLNSAENIVFYATTTPNSQAIVTSRYAGRVNVSSDTREGLIEFTLKNVSMQDAGQYLCLKGTRAADVVKDCGKTLVIVDAPSEANILAADGAPLIGSNVTLHCTGRSSSTSPHDHKQPMRFQWFEAKTDQGQNVTLEWSPIYSGTKEVSQDVDYFDDHDDEDVEEIGSGDGDVEILMESSLSNVLNIDSIGRSDDGRLFACSASEGFDLWSTKSRPYVLRPEWKPVFSDVTFTPPVTYETRTEGESMHVTCSANCRPTCTVKWQKVRSDDQAVTVSTSSILSVTRMGHQQQGLYRCVASNSHGQAFRVVTLNVVERPVPWYSQTSQVIVVVAVVTFLLAAFMTGMALAVVKCKERSSPIRWPEWRKKPSDAVPLAFAAEGPSMVSDL